VSDVTFDDRSPSPGVSATVGVGAIAVVAAAFAGSAVAVAGAGIVLMAVGVQGGRRSLHTIGGVLCFGGVVLAGALGAAPGVALVGAAASVVAWDVGDHAIGLGGQVGRDARARRNVLEHLGISAGAAASVVVISGLSYALARRGNPGAAAGLIGAAVGLFAILLDW